MIHACAARMRLIAAAALLSAAAGAEALTLDARLGYDGYYVPGRWTPVSITVENLPRADKKNETLKDFEGAVRIVSGGATGDRPPMAFSRAVSAPANDRKRVTLYAKFPEGGDTAEIELVGKTGARVETIRVARKAVGAEEPLVAFFRTTDASLVMPKLPDLPAPQMAAIEPDAIPDKWYGYDGVSLLVVPRILDKLLDKERAEALNEWVRLGGRVLFVGGRHGATYPGSPVEKMIPGKYAGSDSYELTDEGLVGIDAATTSALPLAQINRMTLGPEAEVCMAAGRTPLLIGAPYGAGQVFYLTSDWSPRLFQRYPASMFLTSYLLSAPDFSKAAARIDDPFPYGDSRIFGLGSASFLPDIRLVGLILISYLVLVGPVNFYVLARRRRLELAWITVPAIVAAFCVAIFALGSHIRGSGTYLRNYHLVTGRSGSAAARCETLSLVYVPQRRNETLAPEGRNAAAADHAIWEKSERRGIVGAGAAGGGPPHRSDMVRVIQTAEGMALDSKPIRQWDFNFSRFTAPVDLGGTVDAVMALTGGTLIVRVRNGTDRTIDSLVAVYGGSAWKLSGDKGGPRQLRSGEETSATVTFGHRNKSLIRLEDPDIKDETERRIFSAFASTLAAFDPLKPDLPPAFLIGRMAGKPVTIAASSKALDEQSDHTFFALTARVEAEGAGRTVGSATPGRFLGRTGVLSNYNDRIFVGQSPAAFCANLPIVGPSATVEEMDVFWGPENLDTMPVRCDVFDFSVWEWRGVPLRNAPKAAAPREAEDGQRMPATHRNEMVRSIADLGGIARPAHPLTGGVLIKLGRAKDADKRAGLDVAPPIIQRFSTGPFARRSQ